MALSWDRPEGRFFVARALAGGYAVAVWCRSLAGCPASRAALRRPSALLSTRQRECCFRLADARPRALPLPGAEVDAPDESGPVGIQRPARFLSSPRSAVAWRWTGRPRVLTLHAGE